MKEPLLPEDLVAEGLVELGSWGRGRMKRGWTGGMALS